MVVSHIQASLKFPQACLFLLSDVLFCSAHTFSSLVNLLLQSLNSFYFGHKALLSFVLLSILADISWWWGFKVTPWACWKMPKIKARHLPWSCELSWFSDSSGEALWQGPPRPRPSLLGWAPEERLSMRLQRVQSPDLLKPSLQPTRVLGLES